MNLNNRGELEMGRTKGVKNGEGTGYPRPRVSRVLNAKESLFYLQEQGFFDEKYRLTEKGEKYVESKLKELGMYNILLFESYFLKEIDYSELFEE